MYVQLSALLLGIRITYIKKTGPRHWPESGVSGAEAYDTTVPKKGV